MKSFVEPHMKESLKDHVLEEVPAGDRVKAFYMNKPSDGRMMSCLIVSTPEGIVIHGDLCPNINGVCSVYGYDLDWFGGELSERYLCEKFLHKKWQRELVAEELKGIIETAGDDLDAWKIVFDQWIEVWEDGQDERLLYDAMNDAGLDTSDGLPGFEYPVVDAGWLCAIQQRFSELYQKLSTEQK